MNRFLIAAAACILLNGAPAQAKDIVIHAGKLIDGLSNVPRSQVSIVIHDDRITAVQPGFTTPAGAEVIDLSQETVLPGLIDCHVHLTSSFHKGDPIRRAVTRSSFDDLIDGVGNVRATLLAGFTSARDVGGDPRAIVALKNAINAGVIPGPRLWVSGYPLGPSDGHGDPLNGLNEELFRDTLPSGVIDSPEEARKAVRVMRREGVDLIKIMPSGGVMSIGDDPKLQLMTDDEIKAVVDTAHALNMKVAAHAHGEKAINRAIELGVDSIEHSSYASPASYKLYKAHGTYLVPTLLVAQRVYDHAREHPEDLNPSTVEKALTVAPVIQKNLHDAYAAGVRVAFGTDTFGLSAHGENAQEFALMVKAGMPAAEAIAAATRNAAGLIGDTADIGSIQTGRYADIIAVKGDPLGDIKTLEKVDFVMKGGTVYKTAGHPAEH
jgi:imidazolonepropionase-like amidohydrolase